MERKEKTVSYIISIRACLLALAMILSFVESRMPITMIVPGMKLGLTNVVVLFALYKLDYKEAIIINFIRIILVGFTFGNTFSMLYSLAGGFASGIVMIIFKKLEKFSIVTVSVLGGIAHNIGQIIVAMWVLNTVAVGYYLVVLWFTGIVTGTIIGSVSSIIVKKMPNSLLS